MGLLFSSASTAAASKPVPYESTETACHHDDALINIQSCSTEDIQLVFERFGFRNRARARAAALVAARPIHHVSDLPLLPGFTDRSIAALAKGVDPRSLPGLPLALSAAERSAVWPASVCSLIAKEERIGLTGSRTPIFRSDKYQAAAGSAASAAPDLQLPQMLTGGSTSPAALLRVITWNMGSLGSPARYERRSVGALATIRRMLTHLCSPTGGAFRGSIAGAGSDETPAGAVGRTDASVDAVHWTVPPVGFFTSGRSQRAGKQVPRGQLVEVSAGSVLVGQELHSLGLWRRLVGDAFGCIGGCRSPGSSMGCGAGASPAAGATTPQSASGDEAAGKGLATPQHPDSEFEWAAVRQDGVVATSMDGVVATGLSPWIPMGALGLDVIEEEERQFAMEAGMDPPWPHAMPARGVASGGDSSMSKRDSAPGSACTDGPSYKIVSGASSAPTSSSSSSSSVSARGAAALPSNPAPPYSRIEARGPEWTVFLWKNSSVTSEGRSRVRVELMRRMSEAYSSSVTSGKGSVAAASSGQYSVGSFAHCVSNCKHRDSTPSGHEVATSGDFNALLVGQVVSLSEQVTGGSAASECDECGMVRPPAVCALRVTVLRQPFARDSGTRGTAEAKPCKGSEGVEAGKCDGSQAKGAGDGDSYPLVTHRYVGTSCSRPLVLLGAHCVFGAARSELDSRCEASWVQAAAERLHLELKQDQSSSRRGLSVEGYGLKLPESAAFEESRSEGTAMSAGASSRRPSCTARARAWAEQLHPMVVLAGDFNLAAGPHDHGWDTLRSIGWDCAAPAGRSPPAAATVVGKRGSSMDSIWVRSEWSTPVYGNQQARDIAARSVIISSASGQVIRFDLPEEREAGARGRARMEELKQVSDHFPVCADIRFPYDVRVEALPKARTI